MNLNIGERLPGSGPAHQPGGYVVSALMAETPWYGLYAGKKIFYNFDFTHKRLRETDEAEWVDVFLRTIRYPHLEDPVYVAQRRTLARGEVRRILGGRASNLWPEPIDLLEIPGARDPFPFVLDHDPEPIVVFARPHGLPLAGWLQTAPPLSARLEVLAEILEFVRQAHAEGLVLHGLGPAAILVDRAQRIHYIGTDMVTVAPADHSGQAWSRLFPPQRFARGFTPPEIFLTGTESDARGDLYVWGCLAYLLLTGQSPVEIALEQGHPWAQLQPAHFTRLEKCLGEVPATHVRDWADQLGVGAGALTRDWPGNIVHLFQALLHGDASRRPGTVEELLSWIDAPPPIPPAAALALVTGPGSAHIYLDWRGPASGLDMVVRRGVGEPPRTPTDGTLLDQGPARAAVADPAVPLTLEPVYYTVFARRNEDGPTYSAGVSAELEEVSPAAFLRLANSEAGQAEGALLPPRLALLFAVQDKILLIQALSRSDLPVVRGWALAELEQLLQSEPALPKGEEYARQWLRDPKPALRRRAAALLLARPQTDEALLSLARFAGLGDLDVCLDTMDVFVAAGLDPDQAERIREILEGERPTACPECHVHLARRDRAEHLRREYGYIDVGGSLLPRRQALMRLWDSVLAHGEISAHERILQLLAAANEGQAPAYVAHLEKTLRRKAEFLAGGGRGDDACLQVQDLQSYLACLVQAPQVEMLLEELFLSEFSLLHDVARECWLTILGDRLRPASLVVPVANVVPVSNRQEPAFASHCRLETGPTMVPARLLRHELDRLGAPLDDKILVCRRLAEVGVDAGAARGCLALLESDRPVTCVECGARTRLGDLETHLRRLHGIFQFRGVRRSLPETRAAVLDAVCGGVADEIAWKTLDDLAHDQEKGGPDTQLVAWVCQRLITLGPRPRAAALAGLGEVLAQSASGPRLMPCLVRPLEDAAHRNLARLLALEVGARLDPPVDHALVILLEPLLSDRALPFEMRQSAVMSLLRTTGKTGPAALHLLEAYVAKTGKLRSITKLQELEQRIGQSPALDVLCARLEDQVRMTCPKCGTEMIRLDMVGHLWERHRLVLDGRRVREPWRVLDDWIVDYGLEKDPALLKSCHDLAHKLDPDGGEILLQRTLLRHGIEDRAALADLSTRARKNCAMLCPHCFGEIPVPPLPALLSLSFESGSLEGAGFRVAVSEQGLFPNVTIETADESIQSREPGSRLTRNGALLVIVVPLVVAFAVLTRVIPHLSLPLPVTLILALGMGMFVGGLVFLFWPGKPPGTRRLVNAAWALLVPELADELTPDGIAFLGGLAAGSVRKGNIKVRAETLDLAYEKVNSVASVNPAALASLAALVRLKVEDTFEEAGDPLPLVAEQVGRCLRGLLPLSHASLVLADFFGPEAPGWPEGFLGRLQILLCAQAFAAGLELSDLAIIGKTQPTVAAALGLDDLDRLAQLRQLWALQGTRPWEVRGHATPVFDLAADPRLGEKYLARTPDILLKVTGTDIALGSRGVWYQDVCWTTMPERVEVIERRIFKDDGYDLVAGTQRFYFPDNPQELAALLESWLTYYFQEFRAAVATLQNRPGCDAGQKLGAVNALPCPHCRVTVLGRVGEVGVECVYVHKQ